jgi:hypothetical protein
MVKGWEAARQKRRKKNREEVEVMSHDFFLAVSSTSSQTESPAPITVEPLTTMVAAVGKGHKRKKQEVAAVLLTVYFGTPNMFITLWFGFDYGTNPPLVTLII